MNWITLTTKYGNPLRVNLDQLQTYEPGRDPQYGNTPVAETATVLHFANTIGGESRRYVVEDCDTITQRIEDLG